MKFWGANRKIYALFGHRTNQDILKEQKQFSYKSAVLTTDRSML